MSAFRLLEREAVNLEASAHVFAVYIVPGHPQRGRKLFEGSARVVFDFGHQHDLANTTPE